VVDKGICSPGERRKKGKKKGELDWPDVETRSSRVKLILRSGLIDDQSHRRRGRQDGDTACQVQQQAGAGKGR
jgi:hypothetical protein